MLAEPQAQKRWRDATRNFDQISPQRLTIGPRRHMFNTTFLA
jgi:hypothetical protein